MNFNRNIIITIICILFAFNLYPQIAIKAVGDIMPGSITPKKVIPPDSGKVFSDSLKDYLKNADLVIGNLEGAFIEDNMKPSKCSDSSRTAKICYEFGIPSYLVNPLKSIGFNILSHDNNHYKDYSSAGIKNTRKVLKTANIEYLGTKEVLTLKIRNSALAIIPFSTNAESYKITEIENAKKIVKTYSDSNYIVIATFHGGKEGKNARRTYNADEIFLGENRGNVVKFAHSIIDAGADLVIGHGPHVLRGIELYKNKLIAYSLGNFLTYGNINITGYSGESVILHTEFDEKSGDFIKGLLTPIRQHSPGIPYLDPKFSGVKSIIELSKSDFPNNQIIIEENGIIKKITN